VAATKKREIHIPAPPTKEEPILEKKSYIFAIRLKGSFGTPSPLERALETLRLKRKFNAVLLENTSATIGMLRTVKDYVTWGEAGTNDIATVLRERGKLSDGAEMADETIRDKFGEASIQDLASALTQGRITLREMWQKGLNPVFRLHPPSGGFEGSGKRAYGSGGELGRRRAPLSALITCMT
jgi:large subunit ribosomal protein L30